MYQKQYLTDSIYLHDSIFIYTKGDTVYNNKYITKYKYLFLHDTLLLKDTVYLSKSNIEKQETIKHTQKVGIVILILFMVVCAIAIIGLFWLMIKDKFNVK